MARELRDLWGAAPGQLNNAYISFQMTYFRHFPLMYQVYSATGYDLKATIALLKSVPDEGVGFDNVEELKNIEQDVCDYLQQYVASADGQRTAAPPSRVSMLGGNLWRDPVFAGHLGLTSPAG